ncbi:hypothetical protein ABEV77_03965 [Bacillus subtilis]
MRLILLKIVVVIFCVPLCGFHLLAYWYDKLGNGIKVQRSDIKREFTEYWIDFWKSLRY